jgi:hypothetical protein
MSGSGSSGFGGGFERSEVVCERLILNTQIASPKPAVIGGLQLGEVLMVGLEQTGTTSTVVVLRNNQVAGGIAAPEMQRLRECIQQGTRYIAKVTAISGAHISIRISAA